MAGLREQILGAQDIPEEVEDVPEWDCKVLVRGMDGTARAEYLGRMQTARPAERMRLMFGLMVAGCTYDPESRERLFTAKDVDALLAKSAIPVERIAELALRLSGVDMGGAAVEEAAKN